MAHWNGVFDGQKYLSLETFRRSGQGVPTPVWFAAAPDGTLYVYTLAQSGKTKRIRANGRARIAPCDARGRVSGAFLDAAACVVGPDEFRSGMALIDRKYWPMKKILDFSVLLFHRRERVVIALRHPA